MIPSVIPKDGSALCGEGEDTAAAVRKLLVCLRWRVSLSSRAPVLGIRMENTQLLKDSVGQGGQWGKVQFSLDLGSLRPVSNTQVSYEQLDS